MSRIQIALDDISSKEAIAMLQTMEPRPEIIEAGTLLLLREGVSAIHALRNAFPDALILADPKIMDAPDKMAEACFEAGADIVTVMRSASDAILRKTAETAARWNRKISVDFLHTTGYTLPEEILPQIASICFHIPRTSAKALDFSGLQALKDRYPDIAAAAAGGLNLATVHEAAQNGADILILGRSLYQADNPAFALADFRSRITERPEPSVKAESKEG